MDQSGYKKGGDASDTTWDINYIRYIYELYQGQLLNYAPQEGQTFICWMAAPLSEQKNIGWWFVTELSHSSPYHNSAGC